MKNCSCQDEEVPDSVTEAQRAPAVEDHAQTVCQPAQQQEHHRSGCHFLQPLPEDDHPSPAHGQVEPYGWFLKTGFEADFQDQTHQRQPPDDAENTPAPPIAQGCEQKRRIGSGDQEIDGRMVQTLKEGFSWQACERMVERGR